MFKVIITSVRSDYKLHQCARGEGVKNVHNSIHMVYEWPQSKVHLPGFKNKPRRPIVLEIRKCNVVHMTLLTTCVTDADA